MSDYYQILGVSRFANHNDVRKAFRQKAKSLHPDINNDSAAIREFKRVNEAYQVLRDAEKRRLYDLKLVNGFPSEKIYYRSGKVKYRARGDKYAHYESKEQADAKMDIFEKYFDNILFFSLLLLGCFSFFYGLFKLFVMPEKEINPYPAILIGLFFSGMLIFVWRTKDKFKK